MLSIKKGILPNKTDWLTDVFKIVNGKQEIYDLGYISRGSTESLCCTTESIVTLAYGDLS